MPGRSFSWLGKYLRRSSESDRIDTITLAKMPFADLERPNNVHLPPSKISAMLRLARQRKPLEGEVAARKTRIISIVDGYLPAVRIAFSDLWSPQGRESLRNHLNPLEVARHGEKAPHRALTRARHRGKGDAEESHRVFRACQAAATIYQPSHAAGTIDDFSGDLKRR